MKLHLKYIFVVLGITAAASANAQTYYDQQRQYRSYQAQSEATRRAFSVPASSYQAPRSSQSSSYSNSSSSSSYSSSRSNYSSKNYSDQSRFNSPGPTPIPENMKWYPEEQQYVVKERPDCQGSCSETISFAGGEYTGNTKAGKAHGRGTLQLTNGAKYIGTWVDGKLSGESKIFSANGDRYEGGYSNSAMNGWGRYTYKDGDYMEGTWVNNIRTGKGMSSMNGTVDVGLWDEDGNATGTHTFKDKAGKVIRRNFFTGKTKASDLSKQNRHRVGEQLMPTSTSQTFANGTTYEGEVFAGKPFTGKYKFPALEMAFEGTIDEDGYMLKGKYTDLMGEIFEGEFKDGNRYRGTLTTKATKFTGEFSMDGESYVVGRITSKDGTVADRFFGPENSKDGYMRSRSAEGIVQECMYTAGKLTGGFMVVYPTGTTFTGLGDYEGRKLYGMMTYKDGKPPKPCVQNDEGKWEALPEADKPKAEAAAAKGKADIEKGRAKYNEAVKFNPALAL